MKDKLETNVKTQRQRQSKGKDKRQRKDKVKAQNNDKLIVINGLNSRKEIFVSRSKDNSGRGGVNDRRE